MYDPTVNFQLAVQLTLLIEGPMSDDKVNDANGGLTKYGISQVQNPDIDVRNLTQDQAIAFYKERYWDANGCDDLPWPLCYVLFDIDVNNGDLIGAKMLQQSLGLVDDGVIGPKTKTAAHYSNIADTAMRMLAKRGVYYTKLGNWMGNAEGWMYRNAKVAFNCARIPGAPSAFSVTVEPKNAAPSGGISG